MSKENEKLANMIGNAIDFPVCKTEERADPGSLEWLDDDGIEEVITRGAELAFEMTLNENSEVRNSVVVRTNDGKNYGVQLSIEKLMHLGRWSLGNALHQLDLIEEFHADSTMGEICRSMSAREVKTTVEALKSNTGFAHAIDKKLLKETVKAAQIHYQEKLAANEREYSEVLLKLADAIATGNDDALNDPLVLDAVRKAKKLHDDGAK